MTGALRIAVVGVAAPVEAGAPDQRASAALRRALMRFGEVYSAVVDIDGSQLASRGLLQKTMSLTPLVSRKTAQAAVAEAMAGAGEIDDFVSRRRLDRFVRRLAAFAPDVIVFETPVLASLADRLAKLGARLVLCDGDQAAIHRRLAAQAPTVNDARLHALLADQARRGLARSAGLFDQVWATGVSVRLARPVSGVQRVPLASMGVHDLRLSEKTGPAVLISSGIGWLDKLAIADLAAPLESLARSGVEEPGLALIAIDSAASGTLGRAATVDPDWRNCNLRLGQARFLVAPVAGPSTAEMIKSALVSGTPVLCPAHIAQELGFDATAGVYPCRPDAFKSLLARGVLSAESDAEANAAVAAEAESVFGEEACATAVARALGALLESETAPSPRQATAQRLFRYSPLVEPAKLMFNDATRMLLLRAKVLKKLGVSEIRILDAAGGEVTRILANVDASNRPTQEIEGGMVLPRGVELGDMTVAYYDGDVLIHTTSFRLAEIERLEGEIFALNLEGTICEGAFWATTKGDAVWQVDHAGHRVSVASRQGVRLSGLDVVAAPFKLLRTRDSNPGTQVRLSRVDKAEMTAVSLLQRPAIASHLACAPSEDQPHAAHALKDLHKGKRGWMIGNGPSVRLEDLDAVPDDDVKFCFNRFYKCYDDTRLREDYVVSADMLMIDDFGQEMVDKSAGLPLFCRNRVISEVSGRYVELQPGDTYLPLFSYNPTKFVSIGGSSVFVALQMAYYMGLREIFLYGMDFSFSMTLGRDPRYKFPVSFDDNNHFIKGYREAKPWCPPTWRDISAGFLNARAAFELGGGRILNATRGGKLEIFDRVDFETAVGRAPALQKTA